eukprot:gene6855-7623_t
MRVCPSKLYYKQVKGKDFNENMKQSSTFTEALIIKDFELEYSLVQQTLEQNLSNRNKKFSMAKNRVSQDELLSICAADVMRSLATTFIFLGLACVFVIETKHRHNHHHHHSHRNEGENLHYHEKELTRSKRHLINDEIGTKLKTVVSPIKHVLRNRRQSRPYVAGQVQDVQIQIKLKYPWDKSMWNMYTRSINYLSAMLLTRPSAGNILADLSIKFFKTVVDPVDYLEGIVTSGWISGLEVFGDYFKVLRIVNGNEPFPAWNYPKGLKLRLHPAVITKVNAVKKVNQKIILPANYKELRVTFKLYQKWNPFFQARFSSPFRLLSGNIEQAMADAFKGSSKYLDSETLAFRESPQGQVIVDMIVRFATEEVYPAQKLKTLIATGAISGTPVISDSLSIFEINNIHSDKPMQEQRPGEQDYSVSKPKSEANVEIGLNEVTKNPKERPSSPLKIKETSKEIYPVTKPIAEGKGIEQEQQNKKVKNASISDAYNAAQTQNLPDSSDTPTLTKTQYPEFTLNGSADADSNQSLNPTVFTDDSFYNNGYNYNGTNLNVSSIEQPQNETSGGQNETDKLFSESPEGLLEESSEGNEDQATKATKVIVGVISEKQQHFKHTARKQRANIPPYNGNNKASTYIYPSPVDNQGSQSDSQGTYNNGYFEKGNAGTGNSGQPKIETSWNENDKLMSESPEGLLEESNEEVPIVNGGNTSSMASGEAGKAANAVWPHQSMRPATTEIQRIGQSTRLQIRASCVEVYQWPPVAAPIKTAQPTAENIQTQPVGIKQNSSSTTSTVSTVYTKHLVHGKFILQQSWHSLLGNNNSVPYKVLAGIITHSIEQTYSTHHVQVNCKVVGLSKASHNTSSASVGMDKVGVRFDLKYYANQVSIKQTIKQAVASGQISGLMVYPDSLEVEEETIPATKAPELQQQANQTTSGSSIVATSPLPLENAVEVKPVPVVNVTTPAWNVNATAPVSSSNEGATEKITPTESAIAEPVFEFVTAPKELPKSCEEIRDFDMGHTDGEYVLEARTGCHLSVICQNMQDAHPKEYLGGPNKGQWAAYPFAVLIKISAQDKQNMAQQACLESSDEGRKLLRQIYTAKGKQKPPAVPWRSNIKQMLTGKRKRELRRDVTTVILRHTKDENNEERHPRSVRSHEGDWGVL